MKLTFKKAFGFDLVPADLTLLFLELERAQYSFMLRPVSDRDIRSADTARDMHGPIARSVS